MRDDAVIASNTSSLSLTEMAAALDDPSRLIGLHFFNPVDKMPLVEVVRTPLSSSRALGAGAELALRLGKTPVLVVDAPGFLVNRLLIPYLAEALTMASRGADIRAIDAAMKHWGMPMGPFELLDQVGLDIAVHILHAMRGPFGERFAAPERLDEVLQRGWLGRKTKLGFYDYRGRRATVHDALLTMIRRDDARAEPLAESAIQWRLLSPMINEAMRVLEAGVVESTDTIDLATVLGLGLAPFRGGLARFIDTTGLPRIVRRMDELAQTIGPRFAPVEALRQLAEEPRTLAEYKPGKAIESRRASRTHA
jgi:3-hydroxyacyl-CoA dehydrogenase/enoyl-CoA hydratase/3-hydroxybutyryl-CoA epimerase